MPSRRSVLVSGAVLVGGSLASTRVAAIPGVDDDYDCDDETEIAVAKRGDEVVSTRDVPTAWYEHQQHVREIREEFQEEYPLEETEWLRSIGITAIDEPVCDMRQMAIVVGVNDVDTAEEDLGETYQGVSLVIKEAGDRVDLDASVDPNAAENGTLAEQSDEPDNGSAGDGDDSTADDRDEPAEDPLPGFGLIAGLAGLAGAAALRDRW